MRNPDKSSDELWNWCAINFRNVARSIDGNNNAKVMFVLLSRTTTECCDGRSTFFSEDSFDSDGRRKFIRAWKGCASIRGKEPSTGL